MMIVIVTIMEHEDKRGTISWGKSSGWGEEKKSY
jgi:hypothetical protein